MIAVDTNLLVYAHHEDSAFHAAASAVLRGIIASGHLAGPSVHDARIAAVCIANGITELWTADRDYGRIPQLASRNPLLGRG